MLCEECQGQPAMVHLIQLYNGQKQESHLCEECASQKTGLMLDSAFNISIPNLLGGYLGVRIQSSGCVGTRTPQPMS